MCVCFWTPTGACQSKMSHKLFCFFPLSAIQPSSITLQTLTFCLFFFFKGTLRYHFLFSAFKAKGSTVDSELNRNLPFTSSKNHGDGGKSILHCLYCTMLFFGHQACLVFLYPGTTHCYHLLNKHNLGYAMLIPNHFL